MPWYTGARGSEVSPDGNYYEDKAARAGTQTSQREPGGLWMKIRVGAALVLTTAALVLTLIILVAGRHGNGSSDLSLLTINMTDFARFNPPVITLVKTDEATKTRRGLGSFVSDLGSKASDAADTVETFASGAASKVESAVGAVATAAEAQADKIIDEIGDKLEDIEDAVMGLMEKILDTIQDALNKWLQEAASALDDIDIPRMMSLHLTAYCSSNDTTNGTNSTTESDSLSCTRLFRSGETSFNETSNNGTIFGFQPGAVLANALGVFFVPEGAQQAIRKPVDSAVNTVDRLVHEAGSELSAWTVNLLFIPIVAIYALATFFTGLLLFILLALAFVTFRNRRTDNDVKLLGKLAGLCAAIAAAAAFFLLLGSVVLTVIALVAYVVDLAVGVIDITVSSSSKLKWMSWAAFIIMAVLAIAFKVQAFMTECREWLDLLRSLSRRGRSESTQSHMGQPYPPGPVYPPGPAYSPERTNSF